jgi:hypothetical protein
MVSLRNADDDDLGPEYDDEQLAGISADEPTADVQACDLVVSYFAM